MIPFMSHSWLSTIYLVLISLHLHQLSYWKVSWSMRLSPPWIIENTVPVSEAGPTLII